MHTFKLGDQVEVLDEVIQGTITAINKKEITVQTSDGFSVNYSANQLIFSRSTITISHYEASLAKKQKGFSNDRKSKTIRSKVRSVPKMEVDLHIHQLTSSTKAMRSYDMLNLQLNTAKQQLEFAISKRIQRVVFIHGVGAGVLKEELHCLFKKYPVNYFDANFKQYGFGATEVYIYQNR